MKPLTKLSFNTFIFGLSFVSSPLLLTAPGLPLIWTQELLKHSSPVQNPFMIKFLGECGKCACCSGLRDSVYAGEQAAEAPT